MENNEKKLQELTSLCKNRGFIFPSSEIYGGLRSAYDYGPLGVELKRNIMNEWWNEMVYTREDIVGLDASIIMHPQVWKESGHLSGFSDPLVDCKICKERFRADKAPKTEEGEDIVISFPDKGKAKAALIYIKETFEIELERSGKSLSGTKADNRGYKCPGCGAAGQFLSEERQFNLMFRSFLGPVDPMEEIAQKIEQGKLQELSGRELRDEIKKAIDPSTVYLRPETAQAMFVQFQNVQRSMSMKVPFGIAQIGKSFRNEITTRYFIFRSCEFEQMEMEFFCKPDTAKEWLDYWKDKRLGWWQKYANSPDDFKLRQHDESELAHYADNCYDIEYSFPWGWDELEGIASRTDYDLKKHEAGSGKKLQYRDNETNEVYHPYVIEPAAGATRGVLAFLNDALTYDEIPDSKGVLQKRTVLRLHPRLAPYKVAILPLLRKEDMTGKAREVAKMFFDAGINARYDEANAIGKRYRRHDEIGTPYCLTIDGETLEDNTVTIRDRDTTKQERISIEKAVEIVREKLK
ncbi:glycine--tRNA ligase [Candidatus Uabimicrobium sp. HlEnr_7]|uniref:glycine--tRNA ligase n=1 Tax=Candidatus Uabimicrobium helgolandensis TaxID=3095367 RepID=UPI0035584354